MSIQINGHDVIFGESKHHSWIGGSYYGSQRYCETKQRWDIPSLQLHGYVITAFDHNKNSSDWIIKRIQEEVDYDLDQRKKRSLGIK